MALIRNLAQKFLFRGQAFPTLPRPVAHFQGPQTSLGKHL